MKALPFLTSQDILLELNKLGIKWRKCAGTAQNTDRNNKSKFLETHAWLDDLREKLVDMDDAAKTVPQTLAPQPQPKP